MYEKGRKGKDTWEDGLISDHMHVVANQMQSRSAVQKRGMHLQLYYRVVLSTLP